MTIADYQDLFHACTQEGCPLCRLLRESTHRYLDSWAYEHFTDVALRDELRSSQGFCHTHTWQLAHMGASLPLAQTYKAVLSDTIEQLQQGNIEAPASSGLLRGLFETKQNRLRCPACRQYEQAAQGHIHALRKAVREPAFYTQFAASHGLCLKHFQLACTLKLSGTKGDWLPLLRKAQLACLQRLDQELGELIRKHDYRFKDEPRGTEMLSWKRAASIVAGEENV